MSASSSASVERRLQAIEDIVAECGAGAAMLSGPPTLRWIGIPQGEGIYVIVSGGAMSVVAPEDLELGPEHAGERRGYRSPDDLDETLRLALAEAGVGCDHALAVDTPVHQLPGPDRPAQIDASNALARARMRKDQLEIELISDAARIASLGQQAARAAVVAGATELDLWSAAENVIARICGGPVEADVDLMVGDRTALVGSPPGTRRVIDGEPVLFDLAPRVAGYWGDSCATFCCGTPGAALRGRHDVIREALEHGIRSARPGVAARDVDAVMRTVLARAGLGCPHHTGHGVGTAQQEPPWLVPEDETVLEEGMMLALEPGAYSGGFGVRLEHLLVVEASGSRPITTHSIDLN